MISCADAMEASLLARKANNNPAVCSLQGDKVRQSLPEIVLVRRYQGSLRLRFNGPAAYQVRRRRG